MIGENEYKYNVIKKSIEIQKPRKKTNVHDPTQTRRKREREREREMRKMRRKTKARRV